MLACPLETVTSAHEMSDHAFSLAVAAHNHGDVEIMDIDPDYAGLYFMQVRMFRNCVTIPPHRKITDKDPSHHYSFTADGALCMHSEPEHPEVQVLSWSEFLLQLMADVDAVSENSVFSNLWLAKLLPDLYGLTWESKAFRSIIKSYLVDLDLFPHRSSPNVMTFVMNELSFEDRFLLAERMLEEDFRIIQLLIRTGRRM